MTIKNNEEKNVDVKTFYSIWLCNLLFTSQPWKMECFYMKHEFGSTVEYKCLITSYKYRISPNKIYAEYTYLCLASNITHITINPRKYIFFLLNLLMPWNEPHKFILKWQIFTGVQNIETSSIYFILKKGVVSKFN